jgi:hypothetical protein
VREEIHPHLGLESERAEGADPEDKGRDTGLPKPIADRFPDSFEDSRLGEIPKEIEPALLLFRPQRTGRAAHSSRVIRTRHGTASLRRAAGRSLTMPETPARAPLAAAFDSIDHRIALHALNAAISPRYQTPFSQNSFPGELRVPDAERLVEQAC